MPVDDKPADDYPRTDWGRVSDAADDYTAATWGVITDVFAVLERAGYHRGDDEHLGRAVGLMVGLINVYVGRDAELP